MKPYRLMIVDDEEELRQGIIRRMDWDTLGYAVVGEAENGQAGWELAGIVHPDVIITDIKMPFMDGLEMSRHILDDAPDTKIIVLSGFDDFDYAKQAISLGTIEYILKPISADELTTALERLRSKMDEQLQQKRNIERLRAHYLRTLPILREQFLTSLVQRYKDAELAIEQGAQYGVDMHAPYWVVARLHCDREQSNAPSAVLIPQPELIPVSLLEQATESLRDRCSSEIFLYGEDVAILVRLQTPNDRVQLMDILHNLCRATRRFLELHTTVGVGTIVEDCSKIYLSARGAARALEYRVMLGTGRAILIDDVEPDSVAEFDETIEQTLINAIKLGTQDDVVHQLHIIEAQPAYQGADSPARRLYIVHLVTEMMKLGQVYHIDVDAMVKKEFQYERLLSGATTEEAVWHWLSGLCQKINTMISTGRINSAKNLTERSKSYIDLHYMDAELSVETLCEQLYVSPSYFSTVFKRENGEGFAAYLTKVRMQKAAELLEKTSDKTYIIAGKVGFAEPNYFSYVFKKHFGMTPSKFREAHA